MRSHAFVLTRAISVSLLWVEWENVQAGTRDGVGPADAALLLLTPFWALALSE